MINKNILSNRVQSSGCLHPIFFWWNVSDISVEIILSPHFFERLKDTLIWDGREKAAYLLSIRRDNGKHICMEPYDILIPTKKDYVYRRKSGFLLADSYINQSASLAKQESADLIMVHIHPPGYPAEFSFEDGIRQFVEAGRIIKSVPGIMIAAIVFDSEMEQMNAWYYVEKDDMLVEVDVVI